jgi:hypothetical protein
VAWSCDFPPKGILQGPRREYSGRYENRAYGFSVLIPQGVKGYDEDDPLYQRGFGVILGPAPLGYIDVGAEVNSLEETDPRSAVERMLGYMRKDGKRLITTRTTGYRLDTLPGQRSVVFYLCPKGATEFVDDSTVAISPDGRFLFQIRLQTTAARYQRDRAVLEKMLSSRKFIGSAN